MEITFVRKRAPLETSPSFPDYEVAGIWGCILVWYPEGKMQSSRLCHGQARPDHNTVDGRAGSDDSEQGCSMVVVKCEEYKPAMG